jgi:pimeloyl-ACP methyl ester carboxylesterase
MTSGWTGSFALGRLLLLAAMLIPGTAETQDSRPPRVTYVIVHGAWGGGWDWRRVDSILTARGQEVYRVTLTGLGERVHLANPSIGLNTHIEDVVNTIRWEELGNVVLVGHSYGGMVITGAADRVPERIRALIYVDAFLPDSGESLSGIVGERFQSFVQSNLKDGMVQAAWESAERPVPKDVSHPLKTLTDTLVLSNPAARRVAASYILTIEKGADRDDFSPFADRARARGWPVHRMEGNHVPERVAPAELVELLLRLP